MQIRAIGLTKHDELVPLTSDYLRVEGVLGVNGRKNVGGVAITNCTAQPPSDRLCLVLPCLDGENHLLL